MEQLVLNLPSLDVGTKSFHVWQTMAWMYAQPR